MKNTAYRLVALFILMCLTLGVHAQETAELQEPVMIYRGKIKVTPKELRQRGRDLNVQMIVASSRSSVGSSQAVRLTPILVAESGRTMQLAPIQINGRNEQRAYRRAEALSGNNASVDNTTVVQTGEQIDYKQKIRFKPWMIDAHIDLTIEVSGCGSAWVRQGSESLQTNMRLQQNIAPYQMQLHYSYLLPTPKAEAVKTGNAEGGTTNRYIFETDDRAMTMELDEIYQNAMSYPRGSKAFCDLLISAVQVYKQSPVANFNAASAALVQDDFSAADKFLQRVNSSWPEYANTIGIYEVLRGNYDAARKRFQRAAAAGVSEAVHNLEELQKKLDNIQAIQAENGR